MSTVNLIMARSLTSKEQQIVDKEGNRLVPVLISRRIDVVLL